MTTLPSFLQPPVDEVACSLQFESAMQIRAVDLAVIAESFRDAYPNIEEHPPLGPIPTGGINFNFQIGVISELPRLYMIDETSTRLVQLQRDRFGVNWRRAGGEGVYPRYDEAVRPSLVDACNRLVKALGSLGLEIPKVSAIEVTYVNPIPLPGGAAIEAAIRPWSGKLGPELGGAEPTSISLQLVFPIPEIDGTMSAEAVTATRTSDGVPAVLLNLVVRAAVNVSIEQAIEKVDIARDWIVRGFASLTTDAMHDFWQRQDRPGGNNDTS